MKYGRVEIMQKKPNFEKTNIFQQVGKIKKNERKKGNLEKRGCRN